MMKKFFGGKKDDKPSKNTPTTNQTISRLEDTNEMIEKREALLQKKIDQEMQKAREASNKKNKQLALNHLKRKKMLEDQLNKLYTQQSNIEQMKMKMEEVTMNAQIMQAQQQSAQTMQNELKRLNIDKVDDVMDNIREVMDNMNDVSNALATPLDAGDPVDEDDLLAELDGLEQEEIDKQMLEMPSAPQTHGPGKATTGPARVQPAKSKAQVEEEDALAELEAQLAS